MNKSIELDGAIVETIAVGPLMTNVFVLGCTTSRSGVVIDAGYDGDRLLALAAQHELGVEKILQTHAHIDHVAAISEVKAATDAPIFLHPADQGLYDAAVQQGQFFGYELEPLPPVDEELQDGQRIAVGNLECEVMLLPGHSPGSVAFHFEALGVVFSGDVLFAGSIGRVDLPGSDPAAMRESLSRIVTLPDETRVLCGHGPETSIGMEKKRNPFLLGQW